MELKNKKLVESMMSNTPNARISRGDVSELVKQLSYQADELSDCFSRPLGSSLSGVVFPTGHAKKLFGLIDQIDFSKCWYENDTFVVNKLKDRQELISAMEDLITDLSNMHEALTSPNLGQPKYNCIYDYRDEFNKIVSEKLEPLKTKLLESYIGEDESDAR